MTFPALDYQGSEPTKSRYLETGWGHSHCRLGLILDFAMTWDLKRKTPDCQVQTSCRRQLRRRQSSSLRHCPTNRQQPHPWALPLPRPPPSPINLKAVLVHLKVPFYNPSRPNNPPPPVFGPCAIVSPPLSPARPNELPSWFNSMKGQEACNCAFDCNELR